MKKIGFVLALILTVNISAFSSDVIWSETWIALGPNFGKYFYDDPELGNFHTSSSGINFSGYVFYNHTRRTGFFFNYGFLFPLENNLENNFNKIYMFDGLFGPAFRYNVTENFKFYYGIGISLIHDIFLDETDKNIQFRESRYGIGVGGDIGIKFDITDVVFLNIGVTLVYIFAVERESESTTDNWTTTRHDYYDWTNEFFMFGFRPYITLGVNYYNRLVRQPLK
jgi:hypothetical protein